MKKQVHIIATGGTIGGQGDEGRTAGYKAGKIGIDRLLASVPRLHTLAEISFEQPLNRDSIDMTTDVWLALAERVNALANTNIDGIVITHGTDTLEETAYFLHLTVKTQKPVVLTGAMRPATATSPDGPLNLYQAVGLAGSENARGKGVLVVFSDAVYSAREVAKLNTFRPDAFGSMDFGCLGYMREEQPIFYFSTLKRHTSAAEFDLTGHSELPKVEVAPFYAGSDPALLEYLAQSCKGIVIAGAGDGGFSAAWQAKVRQLTGRDVTVVRSTKLTSGVVKRNTGLDDDALGTIAADSLSPAKARVLLMLALTAAATPAEIQRMFDEY